MDSNDKNSKMDEDMKEFRRDYHRCGKYNLHVQVRHLERLANHYHLKYRETRHWTDCIKAHSLYNSISGRRPEEKSWEKKAFDLQTEYWGDNSCLSYVEQQKITHKLVSEIESIRERYRKDSAEAVSLIEAFEGDRVDPSVLGEFYDTMKSVSLSCSESMRQFADLIITQSVSILKRHPPCSFEAVAIGSIARGEATPYSDLEYLFLVQDKNPETVMYFEMLAVTTYFLIGNLAETKLSYMAIKELRSWFDDKGKNGFKIDGLSEGAGNIPTGNGSESQRNHFIVTPQELADRYRDILQHPDPKESLRGDLTAMLTYTKTLFTHQHDNTIDLLDELRVRMAATEACDVRREANFNMLKTDAKKFNFVPDHNLGSNGFNADVKKQLYRFPSIILLDICILYSCAGHSSWHSLELLREHNRISQNVCECLKFILAAATYIRLSTYLYHDSQDDRLSLAQQQINTLGSDQHRLASCRQEMRRWFLPLGLFSRMCSCMIPLKESLAADGFRLNNFQNLQLRTDTWWSKVTVLYYTGRWRQASSLLKQTYPKLSDNPVETAVEISSTSGSGLHDTLGIVSETLFWCAEHRSALQLYNYMADKGISDKRMRIADCYHRLGEYQTAIDILNSINAMSSSVYYNLGQAYSATKRYEDAEKSFVLALQMEYNNIIPETVTDYYGNPLESQKGNTEQNVINFEVLTPEERLHVIKVITAAIVGRLTSLGDVYSKWGKYSQAAAYYKKSLQSIHELYGEGALTVDAAKTLNNLGLTYMKMGQYNDSEECYNQALAIHKQLPDSIDMADALHNLGNLYRLHRKDKYTGESYRDALRLYTRFDPDNPHITTIRGYLSEISDVSESAPETAVVTSSSTQDKSSALSAAHTTFIAELTPSGNKSFEPEELAKHVQYYKSLLQTQKGLYKDGPKILRKAETLNKLGTIYAKMGQHDDSEECYNQALAICKQLDEGIEMADTLHNLGNIYLRFWDDTITFDCFREALDIYTRLNPDHPNIGKIRSYQSEISARSAPETAAVTLSNLASVRSKQQRKKRKGCVIC